MKCELCDEWGEDLRLENTVAASLCPKHRRMFSKTGWEWPEHQQKVILDSRIAAAIEGGDEDRAATLTVQLLELHGTLRIRIFKWLAEQKVEVADGTGN